MLMSKKQVAKIVQEPSLTDIKVLQQRNKKKRTEIFREIRQRHSNFNIGGTRGKTITAYRESVLNILRFFKDGDYHTTKEIIDLTGNKKATKLLYLDHYGWFIKAKDQRACYRISTDGIKALTQYKEVIALIEKGTLV